MTAAISSAERNFAIGERHVPSSCTNAQTRPPAPARLATSVSSSSSLRGASRVPALIARTTPPPPSTEAKTLNSEPRRWSETSVISRPKRVSGRSEPKRSIASS